MSESSRFRFSSRDDGVPAGAGRGPARRALTLAAAAWPMLAWAGAALGQAKKAPVVIGHLSASSGGPARLAAFKDELAVLGWKEGPDYVLEERWANGRWERLQALAGELAASKPAVIVARAGITARAAAKAAPRIPIVMTGDPVSVGLAKSLARPGGMVTGISAVRSETAEKYVELLLAAAPKVKRVGFLFDSNQTARPTMDAARRSAAQHGVEARFAEAGKAEEIESAISRLAKDGAQALVVLNGTTGPLLVERQRIAELALARRWPLVSGSSEATEAGALLSYGVDRVWLTRRTAYYVDRILRGAKPGDLPIEQPTKFELVVNLKTAKALGITLPQSILLQATRVIE
ncbi:MAG: ABC transporter substrate-binding protein [Burkholderiales bacterium]|nr:ABC transporter substrate-binding protein [Burkholderiales bacterium]